MALAIAKHFKDVRGGIQCTAVAIMECGKAIEGKAVRAKREDAARYAVNVLLELVTAHKSTCQRRCNKKKK